MHDAERYDEMRSELLVRMAKHLDKGLDMKAALDAAELEYAHELRVRAAHDTAKKRRRIGLLDH